MFQYRRYLLKVRPRRFAWNIVGQGLFVPCSHVSVSPTLAHVRTLTWVECFLNIMIWHSIKSWIIQSNDLPQVASGLLRTSEIPSSKVFVFSYRVLPFSKAPSCCDQKLDLAPKSLQEVIGCLDIRHIMGSEDRREQEGGGVLKRGGILLGLGVWADQST